MTLLEKLNLEPDAVPDDMQRGQIAGILVNRPMGFQRLNRYFDAAEKLPTTLTNAEFLAACEEWLKKN